MTSILGSGCGGSDPGRRVSQSSLDLVQRAETLALADLGKPLHVAALSRHPRGQRANTSQAFKNTHGLPLCRHLRMSRLLQVRRALSLVHDRVVIVTEIATSFGFVEFGRFRWYTAKCSVKVPQ